jgi:CBS domain-containing membrane protein
MDDTRIDACFPVDISDKDVYEAMKDISGYLDITPSDFKEVYMRAYQHAIRRIMCSVKARDTMNGSVITVRDDTPIAEVAGIMSQARISGVPVLDAKGAVVGVISEKDFFVEMTGGSAGNFMEVIANCLGGNSCLSPPTRELLAGDIMSKPAITVSEDIPMVEVADLLIRSSINRVPVVNAEGVMVGIICRADIIRSSNWGNA